jgi:hypothetical protein
MVEQSTRLRGAHEGDDVQSTAFKGAVNTDIICFVVSNLVSPNNPLRIPGILPVTSDNVVDDGFTKIILLNTVSPPRELLTVRTSVNLYKSVGSPRPK